MEKQKLNELEKLKKDYEEIRKKYSLPEFKKLAEEFDIEKISERDSSFLLRDIRRTMGEKLSAYLHLFEIFLNPANPPMFIYSMLKNLSDSEKQKIKQLYKTISKFEIAIMKLDTIYNEKEEAEFIKNTFAEWNGFKKEIFSILNECEKKFDKESNSEAKGYFG
ncbi:MAG: hypothetical protein ACOYT4_00060 [Nanoarchaeota archaeon]